MDVMRMNEEDRQNLLEAEKEVNLLQNRVTPYLRSGNKEARELANEVQKSSRIILQKLTKLGK